MEEGAYRIDVGRGSRGVRPGQPVLQDLRSEVAARIPTRASTGRAGHVGSDSSQQRRDAQTEQTDAIGLQQHVVRGQVAVVELDGMDRLEGAQDLVDHLDRALDGHGAIEHVRHQHALFPLPRDEGHAALDPEVVDRRRGELALGLQSFEGAVEEPALLGARLAVEGEHRHREIAMHQPLGGIHQRQPVPGEALADLEASGEEPSDGLLLFVRAHGCGAYLPRRWDGEPQFRDALRDASNEIIGFLSG